jgi:hypothetical protein
MYYDSLYLLQYILSKIGFNKNNKYNISIKVIGFNSKKFDVNIFLNYISDPKIHIRTIIGTETQHKSLVLEHDNFHFKLQFLDLKSFLAEGDLDKCATKFARIQEKQKGVFPYELLEENTFVEELSKQEPFKYEEFHSSLKGKNISEEEYNYLTLNKNYDWLEYLQWYNTQYVVIMCPIIDFLIHKFREYDVDMLRNISLSYCADQVKFAMTYKDFNIKGLFSTNQHDL